MTDNTERDELAEVLDNAAPDDCPISFFFGTPTHHGKIFADAILAAGFRKPRTITTPEELDAMPLYAAVVDDEGVTWVNQVDGWRNATLAREVEELYTAVTRAALLHAANTMPIDTLLGADKASVWLRDYAEQWGGHGDQR